MNYHIHQNPPLKPVVFLYTYFVHLSTHFYMILLIFLKRYHNTALLILEILSGIPRFKIFTPKIK